MGVSKFDVLVIGGGASGMMAAMTAARRGVKTAVIEHLDKLGKKILSTGNGKCNYTNLEQGVSKYYSEDPAFVLSALQQFNEQDTLRNFKDMGIYPKIKNGYVYPAGEQAASVRELLELELKESGVTVYLECFLADVIHTKRGYRVLTNLGEFQCKSLIFATGLLAGKNCGCDGSAFPYITKLGHRMTDVVPALVQLKSSHSFFKQLSGVRTEISMNLLIDNELAGQERGELQLTDYGISGIVVFQLSRLASRALNCGKRVQAVIDFAPNVSSEELRTKLSRVMAAHPQRDLYQCLLGMYPKKLIPVFLERAGLDDKSTAAVQNQRSAGKLSDVIKEFKIEINGTKDYADGQVCAGGVPTSEIFPETMMSRIHEGLFFAGELIDVDGICGGYNLQWAWSTGFIAGNAAAERVVSLDD